VYLFPFPSSRYTRGRAVLMLGIIIMSIISVILIIVFASNVALRYASPALPLHFTNQHSRFLCLTLFFGTLPVFRSLCSSKPEDSRCRNRSEREINVSIVASVGKHIFNSTSISVSIPFFFFLFFFSFSLSTLNFEAGFSLLPDATSFLIHIVLRCLRISFFSFAFLSSSSLRIVIHTLCIFMCSFCTLLLL
jgi:hypothetical protein